MKQEHRLVAECYRYLAPFIRTDKDIFLCLDGQAAVTAVNQGRLIDTGLPDMLFTLIGSESDIRVEAKIIDESGKILLMQSQLLAWKTAGTSNLKPHFWISGNIPFNSFSIWRHEDILPVLDKSKAKSKTVHVAAPQSRKTFNTIPELALNIIRIAKQ
jgi:hypothetical protein